MPFPMLSFKERLNSEKINSEDALFIQLWDDLYKFWDNYIVWAKYAKIKYDASPSGSIAELNNVNVAGLAVAKSFQTLFIHLIYASYLYPNKLNHFLTEHSEVLPNDDLASLLLSENGLTKIYSIPFNELPLPYRQTLINNQLFNDNNMLADWLIRQDNLLKDEQTSVTHEFTNIKNMNLNGVVKDRAAATEALDNLKLTGEYRLFIEHVEKLSHSKNETAKFKADDVLLKLRKNYHDAESYKNKSEALTPLKNLLESNKQVLESPQNLHGALKNWLSSKSTIFKPVKSKQLADALLAKIDEELRKEGSNGSSPINNA